MYRRTLKEKTKDNPIAFTKHLVKRSLGTYKCEDNTFDEVFDLIYTDTINSIGLHNILNTNRKELMSTIKMFTKVRLDETQTHSGSVPLNKPEKHSYLKMLETRMVYSGNSLIVDTSKLNNISYIHSLPYLTPFEKYMFIKHHIENIELSEISKELKLNNTEVKNTFNEIEKKMFGKI